MAAQQSLRRSRRTVPKVAPIVIASREQLFHLLAEASQIEHTLMCSLCESCTATVALAFWSNSSHASRDLYGDKLLCAADS
jgi:hypothetical protein